jgi:hypothetical protein
LGGCKKGDRGAGDQKRLSKGGVKKETLPTRGLEGADSTAGRRASAMEALGVVVNSYQKVDERRSAQAFSLFSLSLSVSLPLSPRGADPAQASQRGGDVPKKELDKRQKPTGGIQRWARMERNVAEEEQRW